MLLPKKGVSKTYFYHSYLSLIMGSKPSWNLTQTSIHKDFMRYFTIFIKSIELSYKFLGNFKIVFAPLCHEERIKVQFAVKCTWWDHQKWSLFTSVTAVAWLRHNAQWIILVQVLLKISSTYLCFKDLSWFDFSRVFPLTFFTGCGKKIAFLIWYRNKWSFKISLHF